MAWPRRSGLFADAFSFLVGHRVSIYKKLWEEPGAGDERGVASGIPSLSPPARHLCLNKVCSVQGWVLSVRVEAGFLKPAGKGVFPNGADPLLHHLAFVAAE